MKPMVFYVYKKNWSRELEYSIKSLKNVPHNGIYIIGDKPDYDVPATIIPPEPHRTVVNAYTDVIYKVRTACAEVASSELVLMNDDFFILKPYDLTVYDRGDLEAHISERRRSDVYRKMLENTLKWLKANGYETKDYETHTPMLFNRAKMIELIERIKPELLKGDLAIRSLYGNVYNVPSETITDVKNPRGNLSDLHIISTSEHTFMGELGVYIRGQLDV